MAVIIIESVFAALQVHVLYVQICLRWHPRSWSNRYGDKDGGELADILHLCFLWGGEWNGKDASWRHNMAHYWPFVRGIHRSPVDSPKKEPLMRSFDVFFVDSLNNLMIWEAMVLMWHHCNWTMQNVHNHDKVHWGLHNTSIFQICSIEWCTFYLYHRCAVCYIDIFDCIMMTIVCILNKNTLCHDDVIKWKHFRVTGPLCGEFTGHRWIPLTKAGDAELFFCAWTNEMTSR